MTNKYSEWTDEQINQEVLTRKGYSVRQRKDGLYALVSPDGIDIEVMGIMAYYNEQQAWEVIDHVSDMNEAIPLLRECNGSLVWDTDSDEWEASVPVDVREWDSGYFIATHPDKPARAICEAWLLWKDKAQEGGAS